MKPGRGGRGASLTAFGAAREVTGSKHLLESGGRRVLVDCGIFQGHREEARSKNASFPFDPSALSACVNTHGHLDHCGNYPLLVKSGFRGDILGTPATRDVAGLVMRDSARIQANDARFLAKRIARGHAPRGAKVVPPVYDESDVDTALHQYVTTDYGRPFDLAAGVRATLFDAGHILGSALVHLELEEGLAVGFTGDLGRCGMPIIRDPQTLPPVDYLVLESTYGDRLHDASDTAEEDLAEAVRQTVARGGRLIVPAFAVERTQELIYLLHRLHDAGRIPVLPVYVDSPMAVSATAIFKAHPECYDRETVDQFLEAGESPFAFDALRYVTSAQESKALNGKEGPCLIIASSGMCEAGRVLHHLLHGIGDPRNTVLIVGFMAQNTLGRALAERRPEVSIFGERRPLRARVKILNAFSAHADWREILGWVARLDRGRLKEVFLVHGEPGPQEHLRSRLLEAGVPQVTSLFPGVPAQLSQGG